MEPKNTAVIFARVSSDDQRDGFSLEAQEQLAEKYAKERHLKILRKWKDSESASKEDQRKIFDDMLEFVVEHEVGHVIFDKVDRATRGLKSASKLEDLVNNHNVRFHFTRENLVIDKDSAPQEKFRFYLGTVMAKYYIDNLKTEIQKGLNQRTHQGFWNGLAPFGYKNVRERGRALVEIDPIESKLVQDCFRFYSTGNYTYQTLADYIQVKLQEQRPDSSRKCTKRLIETIITNPFYYGEMRVKGRLIKGQHEPLIEKVLFDSCQKIKGIRAKQFQSTRKGVIVKPFMGFLKCGECSHSITGETVVKGNGRHYTYYRCANHSCAQYKKRVNETDLMNQLVYAFEPFSKWTSKATDAFIRLLEGQVSKAALFTGELANRSSRTRQELDERIQKLARLQSQGVLSLEEFNAAVEVPKRLLKEEEMQMEQIQTKDLSTFKVYAEIIQLFRKAYEFMQLPGFELEKIRLAKLVLSNSTLTDKTMRFTYKKPLDDLFALTDTNLKYDSPQSFGI
jgi:site-specific DNA recombinase